MTMPQPGQPAPDIELPRDGGDMIRLSDFTGKPLVVFFYPKDDTPGCTKEAIGFSDLASRFEDAGAVIMGISKDSLRKHDKFRDKHGLTVMLLSDESGDVCERYGTWVEKNMYGRTYMGIQRATFLVGADGLIVRTWPKVKVEGHAQEVLDALQAL